MATDMSSAAMVTDSFSPSSSLSPRSPSLSPRSQAMVTAGLSPPFFFPTSLSPDMDGFPFKEATNQLLSLIINIFYSDLISNPDAKILLGSPPKKTVWYTHAHWYNPWASIHIVPDGNTKNLTMYEEGIDITDTDLSADNLVEKIGIITETDLDYISKIARSGNKEFMEGPVAGADISMIGQFGVKFYTAYLVAEWVVAPTELIKDCKDYVWNSSACGAFTVTRDTTGKTKMTLFFNANWNLVNEYSDFVSLEDYVTRLVRRHNFEMEVDEVQKTEKGLVSVTSSSTGLHSSSNSFSLSRSSKMRFKLVESEDEKKKKEALKEEFEELCKVIKKVLVGKVEEVVVSDRVMNYPCLVTGEYGWTLNLERIMMMHAQDWNTVRDWRKKKMVINPENPIMKELRERLDRYDESVEDLVRLLFETSLITLGVRMNKPETFPCMIHNMLKWALENSEGSSLEERIAKRIKTTKKNDRALWDSSMAGYMASKKIEQQSGIKDQFGMFNDLIELSVTKGTELNTLYWLVALMTSIAGGTIYEDPDDYCDEIYRILKQLLNIGDEMPYLGMPLVCPLKFVEID